MPKICSKITPNTCGELGNNKVIDTGYIPVYPEIKALYRTGAFVEIQGGPQSGRTSFVKRTLMENSRCPLIVTKYPDEYAGLPRALSMPRFEPDVLMPAMRELLYRKSIDSIIFDTIQDIYGESNLAQMLLKHFPSLLLPVYQAKAVVFIINNDSYVRVGDSMVITSAGGKYLTALCKLRVYCASPEVSPVIL